MTLFLDPNVTFSWKSLRNQKWLEIERKSTPFWKSVTKQMKTELSDENLEIQYFDERPKNLKEFSSKS